MFITFEGGEGSGKSTQISLLKAYLDTQNIPCLITYEPGGTSLGESIRHILLHSYTHISPKTELLLFEAIRAEHVQTVIQPALQQHITVLCDRYIDSSLVYQGYGKGLDLEIIQYLNNFATDELTPDMTFYFDLNPLIGLSRSLQRLEQSGVDESRFEREEEDFHMRVHHGFHVLAQQSSRFVIVDASQSQSQIHTFIVNYIHNNV